MNDRQATRIVRSWIQTGVDRMPERVLDAVLDELDTTPQRRSRWPAWRSPQMPNLVKLGAVVAAVLVVALIGFQLLPADPGIGTQPTAAPTDSPSPIASPSPTASPQALVIGADNAPLGPGIHQAAAPFGVPLTFSLDAGWTATTRQDGLFMYRTQPESFAPALTIDRVSHVFADPCHPDTGAPGPSDPPLGVDELVTALRGMTGFEVGPVADETIGGYPAKRFVLSNTITDEEAALCTGQPLDLWLGGVGNTTNQGSQDQIWVVDVNGTPVAIDLVWVPTRTPPDLVTEAEAIVRSIRFDR